MLLNVHLDSLIEKSCTRTLYVDTDPAYIPRHTVHVDISLKMYHCSFWHARANVPLLFKIALLMFLFVPCARTKRIKIFSQKANTGDYTAQ